MRILLDTHAWIWWVTEDRRLSPRARRALAAAEREQSAALSMISLWEVAKKVEKHQLVLDRPLDDWLDDAVARPGLQLIDLSRPILIDACRLPGSFHGDPADQIIVATARRVGAAVITKDAKIGAYAHVRSIW